MGNFRKLGVRLKRIVRYLNNYQEQRMHSINRIIS